MRNVVRMALSFAITHHMIAQMIGSSRETVSRTMRGMVDQGLIQASRKSIQIEDRSALESSAGRVVTNRFRFDGVNDWRQVGQV